MTRICWWIMLVCKLQSKVKSILLCFVIYYLFICILTIAAVVSFACSPCVGPPTVQRHAKLKLN